MDDLPDCLYLENLESESRYSVLEEFDLEVYSAEILRIRNEKKSSET